MKHWTTVAKREFLVRGLSKTMIISTIITLVLMVGGAVAFSLMGIDDAKRIAVTDDASSAIVTALNPAGAKAKYEAIRVADGATGEGLLREEKAEALLLKKSDGWELVTKENTAQSSSLSKEFGQAIRQATVAANAQASGINLAALEKGGTVQTRSLDGLQDSSAVMGFLMSIVFAVLFMGASMMFGMQIAQSVVEEKQSRIVEILLSAIPVKSLLLGKIVAATAIALLQMALYVAVALSVASFTPLASMLPNLGSGLAWFMVFFVAGFVALSCMWAAAGAMATRQEDLQQTTLPLTMIIMVAYMSAFLAQGNMRVILSYVPILSSILMPTRLTTGDAQWWEALIAIAITVGFCGLLVLLGARIYQHGILRTKVMSFKDIAGALR